MIAREFLDFARPLRLHMLGAGGSGMAPLARLLHAKGHKVSGADAREGKNVSVLRRLGIAVSTGAAADLLPPNVDGVIHTAAIRAGAPPLAEAERREIPALKYARAVGLLSRQLETYAVAGTHGKTTTTAMLAFVLREAGLSPCCLVGGHVPQLEDGGPGGREGSSSRRASTTGASSTSRPRPRSSPTSRRTTSTTTGTSSRSARPSARSRRRSPT